MSEHRASDYHMRNRAPLAPLLLLVLAPLLALATLTAWPAAPAEAQRGQAPLVRIPFPQYDGSLTPYTFELGYPLVTLVYDTLLWRDAQGVPRPWLARSVERSADGRQLTVRLARGVKWHDGTPLTAADVAFTFEFVRSRRHPRFSPQLRDLEGVDVVAPDTVVIRLRRPSIGFLDQPLADLPILPQHLWEGLPTDRLAPPGLPVGSGPYRLVANRRGRPYVFRANNGYFRGRPAVRRIEVPIIRDANRTFRALERGDADMVPVSLPEDALRQLEGFGIEFARGRSYLGTVLAFNTRRPPFNRVAVRRAVARALDLPRIAGTFADLGEERSAVPADRGYLHPSSRWASRRDLHRFDEADARGALGRLGVPPFEILAPDNDPVRLEAGREVVNALRRAGAEVTLAEVSPDALAEAVGQDGVASGFDAAIGGSPPLASYDPDFLRAVFGSGAPLNYSGYSSGRFEQLADRVAGSTDVSSRRAAVAEELRLLARDLPVVPLFFYDGIFAYRRAAHDGWVYVKGSGILDKRSFLRSGPAPDATRPPGLPAPEDPGSFPLGLFGLLSLGLVAVAIAVVAGASVRRRA